ncbi:MAG: hypothetical protein ACR2PX_09280 [Endozoicomonas sp.]|uniref:hypothetical protein n=1 Tax=Endozoicomonas sp. TaxID=1892382 RepID=UPI003D9B8C3C
MKLIFYSAEDFCGARNKKLLKKYENQKIETPFTSPPSLWIYPKQPEDISLLNINDHHWMMSQESTGERSSWTRDYHLPIGDRHMLMISMRATSYGEFYSDEHNVPQECEKTVKAFMENVHVELSEEAIQQREKAISQFQQTAEKA